MDQDYVISLNFHLQKEVFKNKLIDIQNKVSLEIFGEDYDKIPESLTKEKAIEIRDYARIETSRILNELSKKFADQNMLQRQANFEITKLDDISYIKYGYTSREVLKAFEKIQFARWNQRNNSNAGELLYTNELNIKHFNFDEIKVKVIYIIFY